MDIDEGETHTVDNQESPQLPQTCESIDEMIEQHVLSLDRQLVKPKTKFISRSLLKNSEHDSIMLQMFLTNTTDEYDLLMKQVIKPIMN